MSERLAGTPFVSMQPGDYVRQQIPAAKREGGLSNNRADVFGEKAPTTCKVLA